MKKIVVHSKETINKERPIPVASVEPMMQVKKPVDTSSLLQSTNPHTECAMNPHLPMASNSTTGNANVHIMAQKHAQPHRHMYVKPAIKANQLNGQIDRYAAKWIEHGYDFAHPSITTQVYRRHLVHNLTLVNSRRIFQYSEGLSLIMMKS